MWRRQETQSLSNRLALSDLVSKVSKHNQHRTARMEAAKILHSIPLSNLEGK